MSFNDKKVVSIILEECERVPDRCKGYRKELISTMADIITLERSHRLQGTNIQVKINEKCDALGHLLALKNEPAK
jgi:hypothetical protein